MASGDDSEAVLAKAPASKGRSTRTTIWITVPGATLLNVQLRSLSPADTVAGQAPPALPLSTVVVTTEAGVTKAGMLGPGEATFRMAGRLSDSSSVGIVRCDGLAATDCTFTVMRQ